MSEVLNPILVPIDLSFDVEARQVRGRVALLLEAEGRPISHPVSGEEHRARIHLPNGFESTYAEIGSGTSGSQAGIKLDWKDSYGQFSVLHMNRAGWSVRARIIHRFSSRSAHINDWRVNDVSIPVLESSR